MKGAAISSGSMSHCFGEEHTQCHTVFKTPALHRRILPETYWQFGTDNSTAKITDIKKVFTSAMHTVQMQMDSK